MEEKESEYKVFRYNQANNITSLDPAFAKSQNNIWAIAHLFNGLVRLDDSMRVVPDIAREWIISDDGLSYTFILRKDVFFHENECFQNGRRAVTARDFKYSFDRILDNTVNSPGSWIFRGKVKEQDSFQAINDTTFRVNLKTPFLPFLGILTMQYCSALPYEAVEYYGENFRANPVGTGPFAFKKWIENQGVFLSRNDSFFRKDVNIDGVKISLISDRKTAYLEFIQGNLDFLSGLESSFINDLVSKDGKIMQHQMSKMTFQSSPFLNTEYLGINPEALPEDSPLHSLSFRQALNFAIDREKMVKSLRNGIGHAAVSGFIPRGLPSYNESKNPGYTYDPQKAKELMAEYVIAHSEPPIIQLNTNKDYIDICTFLSHEWSKIGVECELILEESAVLREGMRKGTTGFFRASWIADYPDAENFLGVFYGKMGTPPNYTRFQNELFDELYESSLSNPDPADRISTYQTMNQIIIDNSPVIFLFYDETATFMSKRVSGLEINSMKLLKLDNVRLEN